MCDYCDFKSRNRASLVAYAPDKAGFAFVYVDNDKKIMIDNKMLNLKTDTAIKYCPMCGRKLD